MRADRFDSMPQEEALPLSPSEWIAPRLLAPHPRQAAVYGEEDMTDLVEDIRASQWIKPLVITQQDVIISGHRRWKAATALKWRTVPVERRTFASAMEEVEALLRENQYREKTPEQRGREGKVWREIEAANARQRMSDAANARWQERGIEMETGMGVENFPYPSTGTTRDVVAERVGFGSGRTYEKAAQVIDTADTLAEQGKKAEAQALLTVLNEQSIDAAARLLKLPQPEQMAVLSKIAEEQGKKARAAVLEVKKETIEAQAQCAPVKPRIFLASWEDWLAEQPPCDLLLTDPPYSTDVEDIHAFAQAWLPLALSKVKPTGRAYVCVGAYPHELRAYLTVKACLDVRQILVWSYKNTLGPSPTHTYKHNWQAILSFCGPEAPPLDCSLLLEQWSAMEINAPDGRDGTRYHAWQKPDALAERFIRHATRPGDLVLDPFAGTGTFVLAAHRLGRLALGCDRSPEMLALARRRGCEIEERGVQ